MQPVSKVNGTYITYRDAVPDDSNYYYAIIINTTEHLDGLEIQEGSLYFDEQYDTMPNDNSTACMIIIPGENATVTSTHVQYVQTNLSQQNAKEKKTREKRIAPVPYTNSFYDNGLLQPENIMSKESNISDQSKEYAITLLTNETYNPDKYLEKYIFSEDFSNPQEEDGHLLFEILRTSFFKEKYTDASEQLTAFLSQNRSETIKQRALFYLGESFYFDGNYKNAIQTFLKIYEVYPNLTRRWIDSSLDFLNN
ncbi:MAG: hypothetical protein IJ828_09840 [Treponema sp.]|nr:hypothetical protein [Treponema sp.]